MCALPPLLCYPVPSRALSRGALWWPVAWKALVPLKETGFPNGSVVKNPLASAGDAGSIPGSRRSPGEKNDNPIQYSCLGNPTDRGAWWAIVHRVTKGSDMTKRLSTQRETPSLLTLSASLLSVSTHLPVLDSSHEWNHTIYGSRCFLDSFT